MNTTTRRFLALGASGALALGAAACGSSSDASSGSGSGGGADSATINGAGSTFAAPIYQQFGSTVKSDEDLTVNYQGVGSGDGVAQLTAGTVDFAGSDPPMTDEEIAAAKRKGVPLHVPVAFGAITVAYNVPGLRSGVKLDGPTVADVFLGKIRKWNDPAIAKLNPGAKLPDQDITVIHRSDESGTTKGFTTFLAATSPTWDEQVGADKSVQWPTGTGAKGNDGVAAAIKQTEGGVGYVEQAYALQNKFTVADVKNASGRYVAPSLASTSAAGEGLSVPADLRFTLSNPKAANAYPITSQTFAIAYTDLCKAGVKKSAAEGVVRFLSYSVGPGQSVLGQLQYAKLPSSIDAKARAQVARFRCNGKPIEAG